MKLIKSTLKIPKILPIIKLKIDCNEYKKNSNSEAQNRLQWRPETSDYEAYKICNEDKKNFQ